MLCNAIQMRKGICKIFVCQHIHTHTHKSFHKRKSSRNLHLNFYVCYLKMILLMRQMCNHPVWLWKCWILRWNDMAISIILHFQYSVIQLAYFQFYGNTKCVQIVGAYRLYHCIICKRNNTRIQKLCNWNGKRKMCSKGQAKLWFFFEYWMIEASIYRHTTERKQSSNDEDGHKI